MHYKPDLYYFILKSTKNRRIGIFEASAEGDWLILLEVFGEESALNTYIFSRPFVEMVCSAFVITTFSSSKDFWISVVNAL